MRPVSGVADRVAAAQDVGREVRCDSMRAAILLLPVHVVAVASVDLAARLARYGDVVCTVDADYCVVPVVRAGDGEPVARIERLRAERLYRVPGDQPVVVGWIARSDKPRVALEVKLDAAPEPQRLDAMFAAGDAHDAAARAEAVVYRPLDGRRSVPLRRRNAHVERRGVCGT